MDQSQKCCWRIYFKFSFPNWRSSVLFLSAEIHRNSKNECLRLVVEISRSVFGVLLKLFKSIGIGIYHNEFSLSVDKSSGQGWDIRTILWHSDVGNKLVGRISEPHSLNITSNDVGGLVTLVKVVVLNGGAHCIREGLNEDVKIFIALNLAQSTILSLNDWRYLSMHWMVSLISLCWSDNMAVSRARITIRYFINYWDDRFTY